MHTPPASKTQRARPPSATSAVDALFKPLVIGRLTLKNRIVMAPLTRCRADVNHVPTPAMVRHYADRAAAGLLIAEATMVKPDYSTFAFEPGIYNAEQVAMWKQVTDAVHAKGGAIFLQIHHGGRAAPPENLTGGMQVESASAIAITGHGSTPQFVRTNYDVKNPGPNGMCAAVGSTKGVFATPKELSEAEIAELVQVFVRAAQNAMKAGFDGVEVHGANGYLLDSFCRSSSNTRTDRYGGSIENRCRFTLEVVRAIAAAIGSDHVGLRISPLNQYNSMSDDAPEELTKYLAAQVNDLDIAYLHVIRGDMYSDAPRLASEWARSVYHGVLLSNQGYEVEEAGDAIRSGKADAIAFGMKFLTTPDIVERAVRGQECNAPQYALLYAHEAGDVGYNDYPVASAAATA